MYNDHISQSSPANSLKPLSIRLNALPFNEKAAYVEAVCASLVDSRFGPGRGVDSIYRLTTQPETKPAIVSSMTMTSVNAALSCVIPLHLSIIGSGNLDAVGARPQRFEYVDIAIRFQNLSPPNQGRGSP